ncbi:MAG: hypothetical protein L6R39_002131 [Caloplaca ligustica]|nr:MAG: hypothetical protein L6R39_002131 [Caloplaca ligustica]
MAAVEKELRMLSRSLLSRLRQDLSCIDNDDKPSIDYATGEDEGKTGHSTRQWLARPRSLRLTTRPRPPLNPDGTRSRTFNRISRSCDMPSLALDLVKDVEYVSERLVQETLIPLFQKLHPEKSGWNLSLMNLCATNISLTAASAKDGAGRDISKMFKTQEDVLRDWKVRDDVVGSPLVTQLAAADKHDQEFVDVQPDVFIEKEILFDGANGSRWTINDCEEHEDTWQSDDGGSDIGPICPICGLPVPAFAMTAHERFHDLPD